MKKYPQVFNQVYMVPDFISGHKIYWKLDPFFKGVLPYNFTLQISQALDFSRIAKEIAVGDSFYAVDNTKYKQNWSANYNYRILLVTGDSTNYISPTLNFAFTPSDRRKFAMASELLRKEVLLCRYAGNAAWLLKRKSYGTVSTSTVDLVSGVPIADERGVDLGVGLDEGYFNPVPATFVIDRSSADKQLDPTGLGVKETEDLIARLPGYPLIDERDILCTNLEGRRYNVLAKEHTYFPGTSIVISQQLTLRLIPPTDTVYSIKVPAELYDATL